MADEGKKLTRTRTRKRKRKVVSTPIDQIDQATVDTQVPEITPSAPLSPEPVAVEVETDTLEPRKKEKRSFWSLGTATKREKREKLEKREITNKSGRRLWLSLLGLAGMAVGVYLFGVWNAQPQNTILGLATVSLILGGAYVVYLGFKRRDSVVVVNAGGDKPGNKIANSLNIYARRNEATKQIYPEKVVFELVEKPLGQPQQCTNNSKWYYVHMWDIDKGILTPFVLPDSQYFDPREFANVIKMPAHKKLFERRVTLLQQIAPWAMVVAFVVAIIGFIATTPPPTGG